VVDVDVGIEDEPNFLIGDLLDPSHNAFGQSRDLVVHEENPFGTGQYPDVSTSGRGLEHVDLSLNGDDDHFHRLNIHRRGDQGFDHNDPQKKKGK
jgi:hypothetical protein